VRGERQTVDLSALDDNGQDLALLFVGGADDALAKRADIYLTLDAVLSDPAAAIRGSGGQTPTQKPRIVAITSCPTGIAHTFMAAEGLTEGARQLDYPIRIETQGSVGAGNPLTADEIAQADVVLIAADREVDRARFAGKRVFISNTKPAITGGARLIERALAEAQVQGGRKPIMRPRQAAPRSAPTLQTSDDRRVFHAALVVAGGLLIALAFALGGIHANDDPPPGHWPMRCLKLGPRLVLR
jgi:PTS system fructose-specific IIC component